VLDELLVLLLPLGVCLGLAFNLGFGFGFGFEPDLLRLLLLASGCR
jgi:hypothetical protein